VEQDDGGACARRTTRGSCFRFFTTRPYTFPSQGHGDEASHFALELTYNYGISSYARGNDLRHLAVSRSAVRDASALSPPDAAGRVFATDPDGYRFLIVDAPPLAASPPNDPFLFASLSCSSLPASVAFYERGLGATRAPRAALPPALAAALEPGSELLQFAPGRPGVELVQLPAGQRVDRAVATGRFAMETEDGAPEAVAPAVRAAGGAVLHGPIKLQPHGEEVTIAQDLDGHEFCFVDARGYRNCIAVARTGAAVDWAYRQRLGAAAALTGEAARAGVAAVLAGEYDSAAVRARIQREAAASPVLLYSQTSCPYCKKSKELLAGLGARGVRVVELDTLGAEGHAVRAELAQLTGRSSVPAIYVGGSFVGGFSDGPGLGTLAERGELVPMLQKAGAL